MRKMFYICLFVAVLASVTLHAQTADTQIISVLDFNTTGISKAEVEIFVDYLCVHIVRTGRYRLIDKMQRESLLREMEFSYEDCTDESCQLEIGKLLAANQIVVGSIGKVGERYLLTIKLIDVETGEAVKTGSEKYNDLNQLIDDSERLATEFVGEAEPERKRRVVRKPAAPGEPSDLYAHVRVPDSAKYKAAVETYLPLQNPACLGTLASDRLYLTMAVSNPGERRWETVSYHLDDWEQTASLAIAHTGYDLPLGRKWGLGVDVIGYVDHYRLYTGVYGSADILPGGAGASLGVGRRLTDTLSAGCAVSLYEHFHEDFNMGPTEYSGKYFRQAFAVGLQYRNQPSTVCFDSLLGYSTEKVTRMIIDTSGFLHTYEQPSPLILENTLTVSSRSRRTICTAFLRSEIGLDFPGGDKPRDVAELTLAVEHWLLPWLSLRGGAEGFLLHEDEVNNLGAGAVGGATVRLPAWKLAIDLDFNYRARPSRYWLWLSWEELVASIVISRQNLFATR